MSSNPAVQTLLQRIQSDFSKPTAPEVDPSAYGELPTGAPLDPEAARSTGNAVDLEKIAEVFRKVVQGSSFDDAAKTKEPSAAEKAQAASFPERPLTPQGQAGGLKGFVAGVQSCGHRPPLANDPSSKGDPFSNLLKRSLPERSKISDQGIFSVDAVRRDFPVLHQNVNGHPLAWFDNAATTQKPQSVIDAVSRFYERDNSNIHRGAHTLAARATDAFEGAREKVRSFVHAGTTDEIVFVRGTTEGLNLVAHTLGPFALRPGDEILLTVLEHHANIVPWQIVAKETGARIRVAGVNDRGEILLDEYERLLNPRTKIVSFAHANNSLGTILPIREMAYLAKKKGAYVVVDAAQSIAHLPVDVTSIGADFLVFSGHKIFSPTGIGVVWGRKEILEAIPVYQGGGNMIHNVTFEETTYNPAPAKFEAGTPNVADAVGLGAAIDYVRKIGLEKIAAYEHELLEYATDQLGRLDTIRLIGSAQEKVGVVSFVHHKRSVTDVGKHLDRDGIAVRAGHHCAQPSLRRFGLEATVRPSFSFYNTREEIDRLVSSLRSFG